MGTDCGVLVQWKYFPHIADITDSDIIMHLLFSLKKSGEQFILCSS